MLHFNQKGVGGGGGGIMKSTKSTPCNTIADKVKYLTAPSTVIVLLTT